MTSDPETPVLRPLTPARWADFEDLFGPERGASGGCWCMWWRFTTRRAWEECPRAERKARFRALVETGDKLGVLAYRGGRAVGWCAVGPRASLPRFNGSRIARPVEDRVDNVWAINCFYIRSGHRRAGMMDELIAAAVGYAAENGARAVEACPIDTERNLVWGEGYVGIASAFTRAGFAEIARRSPKRPLVRLELGG